MAFDISALVNVFKRNPIRLALGLGLGLMGTIALIFADERLYSSIWNPWAGSIVLVIGAVFGVGVVSLIHEIWLRIWHYLQVGFRSLSSALQPMVIRRRLKNLEGDERDLLLELLRGRSAPLTCEKPEYRHVCTRLSRKGILVPSYVNPHIFLMTDEAWIVISERPSLLQLKWAFLHRSRSRYLTHL